MARLLVMSCEASSQSDCRAVFSASTLLGSCRKFPCHPMREFCPDVILYLYSESCHMAGQEAEIGALGIIILAGVIGRLFLKKTGVSDVFLLLLFGACAGALLQPDVVEGMGALMLPLGAVALLMIIMDEGLRLSFESLRKQLHKALFLGILSFSLAFALSFAISY